MLLNPEQADQWARYAPPFRLQPPEDAELVEAVKAVSPNPYPGVGARVAPLTATAFTTSTNTLELLGVLLAAARG